MSSGTDNAFDGLTVDRSIHNRPASKRSPEGASKCLVSTF